MVFVTVANQGFSLNISVSQNLSDRYRKQRVCMYIPEECFLSFSISSRERHQKCISQNQVKQYIIEKNGLFWSHYNQANSVADLVCYQ